MAQFHLIEYLGFEEAFACIFAMLLVNVTMHTRLKYGDMVVTHITTRPYKVATVFLVVALLESIFLIYLNNIWADGDFTQILTTWNTKPWI